MIAVDRYDAVRLPPTLHGWSNWTMLNVYKNHSLLIVQCSLYASVIHVRCYLYVFVEAVCKSPLLSASIWLCWAIIEIEKKSYLKKSLLTSIKQHFHRQILLAAHPSNGSIRTKKYNCTHWAFDPDRPTDRPSTEPSKGGNGDEKERKKKIDPLLICQPS